MSGLRLGVHERLRARIPTTPEAVNELAAGMRTGRVSMNERGCPCLDHATACADRNHGRKIRGRYPPVFPTRGRNAALPEATVTSGGLTSVVGGSSGRFPTPWAVDAGFNCGVAKLRVGFESHEA